MPSRAERCHLFPRIRGQDQDQVRMQMANEVRTYCVESKVPGESSALYPVVLGGVWDSLDASLRSFHGVVTTRHAAGTFDIQHGFNRWARLLAWILRLPAPGEDVPIQLIVRCEQGRNARHTVAEVWERRFGSRTLTSRQCINSAGMLVERFGLVELSLRLWVEHGALCFSTIRASIAAGRLRLRLPFRLAPLVEGRASGVPLKENCIAVSVKLYVPILGLLLAYEGRVARVGMNP